MKQILLILSLLFIPNTISSTDDEQINIPGIVVVHYNATWNKSNNYLEVTKLTNTKVVTAWIDKENTIRESENINSVPTVILYNDGQETKRWEADISLSLKVPYQDIQKQIDILSDDSKKN